MVNHRGERKLPAWVLKGASTWGEPVAQPEWDEDEPLRIRGSSVEELEESDSPRGSFYRRDIGWLGSDMCHSADSSVRCSHYRIKYPTVEGGVNTTLTGVAHFTRGAESHAGYCHGGSMTAVMDDIVGWTAFHVRGECRPWSGFTAQVNCKLMKPIDVSSYLKVIGVVTNWQGRKVWVHAKLVSEDEEVHCTCEGLVILKKESADETGASS